MSNTGAFLHGGLGMLRTTWLVLAAAWPCFAGAQSWFVQPGIKTELTATSNAGYGNATEARSDVIVNVSPGLVVRGNGPRFKVDGSFYVDAVGYVNGTQSNKVLPHGNMGLNGTLMERLLFLDASVTAEQTSQTPFGARPDGASSHNTQTTSQFRFNPYTHRELAPDVLFDARANNTWVRTSGASGATANSRDKAYVQDQFLTLERKPVPFGAELQLGHQDTRYGSQDESALVIDKSRVIVSYAFYEQLALGLIGGYERNQVPYGEVSDSVFGLRTKWQPNERTKLDATVENRFFGVGWDAEFQHRTPFQAWNLRLIRRGSTYASTLASLPGGGNVESLLDASFTTRYPDPIERSRVVRDLIATRGLPTSLTGPIDIYTESAQLEQSATATYVFTGLRNTMAWSYYFEKREPLLIPGSPDALQSLLAPASSQHGLAFQFNHRLTPLVSFDALARWSRLEGRGSTQGSTSRESVYRAGLAWMLAPQTTGTVGLRWQQLRSNVASDAEETALFMGLDHRF